MTEAEERELFARLERLERSAWRWGWFASALAVLFLALGFGGLVSLVALAREAVARQRLIDFEAREAERRARDEAEVMRQRAAEEQRRAAEAEARKPAAQGAKGQTEGPARGARPGTSPRARSATRPGPWRRVGDDSGVAAEAVGGREEPVSQGFHGRHRVSTYPRDSTPAHYLPTRLNATSRRASVAVLPSLGSGLTSPPSSGPPAPSRRRPGRPGCP